MKIRQLHDQLVQIYFNSLDNLLNGLPESIVLNVMELE